MKLKDGRKAAIDINISTKEEFRIQLDILFLYEKMSEWDNKEDEVYNEL